MADDELASRHSRARGGDVGEFSIPQFQCDPDAMNTPAPNEPVAIPSLQDAESQRLGARMVELARTLAATERPRRFTPPEFLAQALVVFATRRQFRPWGAPLATA